SNTGVDIWADRLIEEDSEPSVTLDTQLPRIATSLDSAVIRRGIRRPPEPRRDREVRGGHGNRGSRDPISASVEMPRATDFPGDVRRARDHPVIYVSREILHP